MPTGEVFYSFLSVAGVREEFLDMGEIPQIGSLESRSHKLIGVEHDFWYFFLIFFFLVKEITWYGMTVIEYIFVSEIIHRREAIAAQYDSVISICELSGIDSKCPFEAKMA